METVITDIIDFLEGRAPDQFGRLHAEMLSWSDHQLEVQHDYIQHLFPNTTTSAYNPDAPIIDTPTLTRLRENDAALAAIERALSRMMQFWGFQLKTFPSGEFQYELIDCTHRPQWLRPGNHNYKRVTRVLHTLRLCGLNHQLEAVVDALELLKRSWPTHIDDTAYEFWKDAAGELW